jgi:hypothetical protein
MRQKEKKEREERERGRKNSFQSCSSSFLLTAANLFASLLLRRLLQVNEK